MLILISIVGTTIYTCELCHCVIRHIVIFCDIEDASLGIGWASSPHGPHIVETS